MIDKRTAYSSPTVEIVLLAAEDLIATSGLFGSEEGNLPGGSWTEPRV